MRPACAGRDGGI